MATTTTDQPPAGMSTLDRRPWIPTAAVGALAVLALGGTAWWNPLKAAVGSAYSEAPGHLFGLWATARNLFRSGPFVRMADAGYPDGFQGHLMDPINLLLFLPFYALGGGGAVGATLGWNALHAGAVAIGAWGCWRLARHLIGDLPCLPWAAALLAAVFCLSPYLLYVPSMGRTEYLPAVLYPVHLALMLRWLRVPPGLDGGPRAEPPPLWVGLAAALVLGAAALGGWYLAVFLALAEIPIALWMASGLPWREAAWRLVSVAVIAAACLLPAAWALYYFPPDHGSVLESARSAITLSNFPVDPLPELFRIRSETRTNRWMDQVAYVGVLSLVVGLVGFALRPRQGIWIGAAFWLLSLAPGPYLVWEQVHLANQQGVEPIRLPLYYLAELLPPLKAMRTWSRIGVVASLLAGAGAAVGYALLARRLSRGRAAALGVGLIALALADQATYPVKWSPFQPWFDAHPPEALGRALAALPEGPIIQVPIDLPLRRGGGPEARGQYLLWHLDHGRPISATPKGVYDTTLTYSALTRQSVNYEILAVEVRKGSLDPNAEARSSVPPLSDEEARCALVDAHALAEKGFAAVVLHRDRAGASELDELLTRVLGEADFDEAPVMAWSLHDLPEAETGACSQVSLPERIGLRVNAKRQRKPQGSSTN